MYNFLYQNFDESLYRNFGVQSRRKLHFTALYKVLGG